MRSASVSGSTVGAFKAGTVNGGGVRGCLPASAFFSAFTPS